MPEWASLTAPAAYPAMSTKWTGENNLPLNFPVLSIPGCKSPATFPTCPVLTHHVLHLGQASLPAVVYEPQYNNDGTDGADDHQYHKEFPIIAARLVGMRLAACRG